MGGGRALARYLVRLFFVGIGIGLLTLLFAPVPWWTPLAVGFGLAAAVGAAITAFDRSRWGR
jgi:hypothetical protein